MQISLRRFLLVAGSLTLICGVIGRAYVAHRDQEACAIRLAASVNEAGGSVTWHETASPKFSIYTGRYVKGIEVPSQISEKEAAEIAGLLERCNRIESIALESTNITDVHIAQMLRTNTVVQLRVSGSQLTNKSADAIAAQKYLRVLDVRGTDATWVLFSKVCSTCPLEEVYLSSADWQTTLALAKCPTIKVVVVENAIASRGCMSAFEATRPLPLEVHMVRVSNAGEAFESCEGAPIERLWMERCGELDPGELAAIRALRQLVVEECQLDEAGIRCVGKMCNLESLRFAYVSGRIDFSCFAECRKLQVVYCEGCDYERDSVEKLRRANPRVRIVVK